MYSTLIFLALSAPSVPPVPSVPPIPPTLQSSKEAATGPTRPAPAGKGWEWTEEDGGYWWRWKQPIKATGCSGDDCPCGCNEGGPCTCGGADTASDGLQYIGCCGKGSGSGGRMRLFGRRQPQSIITPTPVQVDQPYPVITYLPTVHPLGGFMPDNPCWPERPSWPVQSAPIATYSAPAHSWPAQTYAPVRQSWPTLPVSRPVMAPTFSGNVCPTGGCPSGR